MKRLLLSTALLGATLTFATAAVADEHGRDDRGPSHDKITVAVFGDWPYSTVLLNSAPLLLKSINSDPAVEFTLHVGDIHSGSMACTSAGILPPIPTSNPGWNQQIFSIFQQFKEPFIYTPGDNEWTDCHKSKEFSSGDPLKELASIRSLFFAKPGRSLGLEEMKVWSQAQFHDPSHPTDAQFVENMIWQDGKVVFVTLNMPGSNNDKVPWTGSFANPSAQAQEVAERTDADIRWLQSAFKQARDTHADAVVIALQADMWDLTALPSAGGDGLDGYTSFVQEMAQQTLQFRKPVLLLNGDSHVYGSDHPLADPTSPTGLIHNTPPVPNLTRITVQGSTNAPAEWLRLTIDPHANQVFTWKNVVYCNDPSASCP